MDPVDHPAVDDTEVVLPDAETLHPDAEALHPDTELRIGTVLRGRYQLVAVDAIDTADTTGEPATAWRATDTQLHRPVTVVVAAGVVGAEFTPPGPSARLLDGGTHGGRSFLIFEAVPAAPDPVAEPVPVRPPWPPQSPPWADTGPAMPANASAPALEPDPGFSVRRPSVARYLALALLAFVGGAFGVVAVARTAVPADEPRPDGSLIPITAVATTPPPTAAPTTAVPPTTVATTVAPTTVPTTAPTTAVPTTPPTTAPVTTTKRKRRG